MNEEMWLSAAYPGGMIMSLWSRSGKGGPVADERFRRFGIACTRRALAALPGGVSTALDLVEASFGPNLAATLADARRLHQQQQKVLDRPFGQQAFAYVCQAVSKCLKSKPTQAAVADERARDAVCAMRGHVEGWEVGGYPRKPPHEAANRAECLVQARIARDVFGNPFRPLPVLAPEWRTSTVLALAKQMFDTGDFSAMPILADALQDAGCDGDVILSHCRDPEGVHVRGCWVVDLVLAKQ
jgi:hypothetical protein